MRLLASLLGNVSLRCLLRFLNRQCRRSVAPWALRASRGSAQHYAKASVMSGAGPLLASKWPDSSTACNIEVVSRHSDKGGKDT